MFQCQKDNFQEKNRKNFSTKHPSEQIIILSTYFFLLFLEGFCSQLRIMKSMNQRIQQDQSLIFLSGF